MKNTYNIFVIGTTWIQLLIWHTCPLNFDTDVLITSISFCNEIPKRFEIKNLLLDW